jgi:hypothetical protein
MTRQTLVAHLGLAICLAGFAQGPPPKDPDIPENISPTAKFENLRVKYQPTSPKPIPTGPKGIVVVRCKVGSDGLPSRIKAIQGPEGYYAYSEAYLSKWVFYPATLDGKPVATWFQVSLTFPPKR